MFLLCARAFVCLYQRLLCLRVALDAFLLIMSLQEPQTKKISLTRNK